MAEMNPQVPLELAELLHVTLGPLNEVLRIEDHPWAALIGRVLDFYERGRDAHLAEAHGAGAPELAAEAMVAGVGIVESLVDDAETEEHFAMWDSEIGVVEDTTAREQKE